MYQVPGSKFPTTRGEDLNLAHSMIIISDLVGSCLKLEHPLTQRLRHAGGSEPCATEITWVVRGLRRPVVVFQCDKNTREVPRTRQVDPNLAQPFVFTFVSSLSTRNKAVLTCIMRYIVYYFNVYNMLYVSYILYTISDTGGTFWQKCLLNDRTP